MILCRTTPLFVSLLFLGIFLGIFSGAHSVYASESSGTITTGFVNAKVCHSAGCVTPTPGVINFKPTGTTAVTIDDTLGIDGIAWGNELGWITFDPTGPEGLTINTSTGVISGKAWSQVSGWINFAPTGQSVSINSSGQFVGWAWTGGPYGGWIKFDCGDVAACVKTDWRPLSARTTTTPIVSGGGNGPIAGGGGGGGSPDDQCWNITGIQYIVPLGYTRNGNSCQVTSDPLTNNLIVQDSCPNIAGTQATVPTGYVRDTGGLCVPQTADSFDGDRDGIPDSLESGDSDQDGVPDSREPNTLDTDGDRIPNHLDPDDDGDGYPTSRERTPTTDQENTDQDYDGIPAYLDAIFNGRVQQDATDETQGSPAPRPKPKTSETHPLTDDGVPGSRGGDDTAGEAPREDAPFELPEPYTLPQNPQNSVDSDADRIPDIFDPVIAPRADMQGGDSDGDGVYDAEECLEGYPCEDDNNDGVPNYLQPREGSGGSGAIVGQQGGQADEDQKHIVSFAFVPSVLQVPLDAPALSEGFRAVSRSLFGFALYDPQPDAPARVDATSVGLLVVSSSAAMFAAVLGIVKALLIVGLLM